MNTRDNEKADSHDARTPLRPARLILENEIGAGMTELNRRADGLLISGLSAGLDIGFSLLLIGVLISHARGLIPEPVLHILVANMYTVGFIFVVLGRSELFTEHTTLAVLPVLNRSASLGCVARLWGLVYVANLVGATIFAAMVSAIAPALGVIEPTVFGEIARGLVDHSWGVILVSGILAGWLMGLLSWLVAAGRDTISQIVIVWLVTAVIGFCHLHHSILGSVEVLAGYFSNQGIALSEFFHFLLWATLGNSIGGVVFVALVKYSHVVRSPIQEQDGSIEDDQFVEDDVAPQSPAASTRIQSSRPQD